MSEFGGRRTEGGGPDRFDVAIDRAVRDILDAEQPAGFRGRVLRGIERPQAASGFSRKILWLGAPLAAAAIVVLALLIPRGHVQPQTATPIASVQSPSSEPAPDAGRGKPEAGSGQLAAGSREPSAGSQKPEAGSPKLRQVRAANGIVAAATTDVAGTTIEIEPLQRIVPIEFAPLSQSPIAPAEIAVRPLNTISELQIAPLNPPDRRN